MAPTSVVSLADYPVDAMALSFYKMFGFPTGVGALVVKESFLMQLSRPWFAGGTVDLVQAPGMVYRMSDDIHSRFEVSPSVSSVSTVIVSRHAAIYLSLICNCPGSDYGG